MFGPKQIFCRISKMVPKICLNINNNFKSKFKVLKSLEFHFKSNKYICNFQKQNY